VRIGLFQELLTPTPHKPHVLMGFCTHSQALMTHKPLHNPDISRNLTKGQGSVREIYMTAGKAHTACKTHAELTTSAPRPDLVQRLPNLAWRSCLEVHGLITLAGGSYIASFEMSHVLGQQPATNACHGAGIVKRASFSSHHARAAYQRKALTAGRHPTITPRVGTLCRASSARADEPQLVRQRSQPWNYKLGAVYQNLLPGPLLFLPSLLQPVSTIISLEGAAHGHEWVHWLLSLLPVPQVTLTFNLAQTELCTSRSSCMADSQLLHSGGDAVPCSWLGGCIIPAAY